MESEKVSINVNSDKLAAIDLLVEEGLVANRSAFINRAIDLLIEKEQRTIDTLLAKKQETLSPGQWFIGLSCMSRETLLRFQECGIRLTLRGFGSLYLDRDIEAELIQETVERISKKIRLHGTDEQLEALANKIG